MKSLLQTRPATRLLKLLVWLTQCLLIQGALATSIVINNQDDPGEGFNDLSPVAAVGGNDATTLGGQRLAVFKYAAQLVATAVDSSEDIIIAASFDPLSCTASSGTLGEAGPNNFHKDFSGAPQAQTYYAQAQANSLLGADILPASDDMSMMFNSSVDNNNNCLNNRNWYYGFDGNAPGNDIDLLTTVLHEMIHGLGFVTLVNLFTGDKPGGTGCPPTGCDDAYMRHIEDHSLGANWPVLSDTQRAASVSDDPDLHFTGSNVQANLGGITGGIDQGHARLHGPASVSGASVAHFSTALNPYQLMEPIQTDSADNLGLAGFVLQDMGWPVFAAAKPIVSKPADQLMLDTATLQLDIAIMDNDSDAASVAFNASSSNPSIISNGPGLVEGGSGRTRTLTIAPVNGAVGVVTITLDVSDGSNMNSSQFDVEVTDNLPPVVSITAPANGQLFYGAMQDFSASASDNEQGNISASLSWTSSINGSIGSGANITASLSDGTHQITASVIDNAGNSGDDTISVTVDATGDADSDGLPNGVEIALGTDPNDSDTDNDLSSDYSEVNRDGNPGNYTVGTDTDPNNPDTDGDGIFDGPDLAPLDPNAGGETVPALPLWGMALLSLALLAAARRGRNKLQ